MKILIITIIFTVNSFVFATQVDSDKKIYKLMHKYLHSIKSSNEQELKKIVSPKYFLTLKKDGQLEQLFLLQKKDGKKIDFDLKVQKLRNNDEFLVNIKDKKQKEYDHFWYVVILKDNKLYIDREYHMD